MKVLIEMECKDCLDIALMLDSIIKGVPKTVDQDLVIALFNVTYDAGVGVQRENGSPENSCRFSWRYK